MSCFGLRQNYPLPPGNYVAASDDYGIRLGQNLKRLRESSTNPQETPAKSASTQSKSVGGFLRESPLDNIPRRHTPAPQPPPQIEDEAPEPRPVRTPLSKIRAGNTHRSRSLTLPPKASNDGKELNDEDEEDLASPWVDDSEPNSYASPFYGNHIARPSSNPIHIEASPSRSHRRESESHFPLTDGAMAEFAALSSTPMSNPGVLI